MRARPDDGRIHVVIADDEPMVCAFVRGMLATADDIVVDAEALDGAGAVEEVVRHRPDVVLMDLRMPGVDGITATREIAAMDSAPVVVVLTTFDTDEHILDALAAGATGFLLKTTPPERLVHLVRAAAAGGSVLSPEALARLQDRTARPSPEPPPDARIDVLGEREREVLRLLADGRSNAEIADGLYLSEATVKGYVSRLMTKLDCRNRTQLAILADRALR